MATHRFTVNIPNPSPRKVAVELRLERVERAELRGLGLELPKRTLKAVNAGITLDPCGEETQKRLALRLGPEESLDVHVVIEAAPAPAGGLVAFHLVDSRGGRRAGGVTLACVEPPLSDPAGQLIKTAKPCPVVLARDPYPVSLGSDPSSPPTSRRITLGTDVELVAPIVNPQKRRLEDVEVYLEHLGTSDAEFAPATWSVGRLGAGDVFFASWLLRASGVAIGVFETSVVVASRGTDPVRLAAPIEIRAKATSRKSG